MDVVTHSSFFSYYYCDYRRNSFGYFDWSSKDPDKNVTESIKWGIQHYDIVIGQMYITANRINEGISFTSPIFSTPFIMVRNVEPSVNGIAYFNWLIPFDNDVWLVVLAVIVISSFIFQFIEYIGNGREDRSFRKWTKDNIYLGFMNATQNFVSTVQLIRFVYYQCTNRLNKLQLNSFYSIILIMNSLLFKTFVHKSHEPKTLGGCVFAVSFSVCMVYSMNDINDIEFDQKKLEVKINHNYILQFTHHR